MGLTVIVTTDTDLTISLTTFRIIWVSPGVVASIGLQSDGLQILVAKGAHPPVAAYEPICNELPWVDTHGATTADMRAFNCKYRRRQQPAISFDRDLPKEDASRQGTRCRQLRYS